MKDELNEKRERSAIPPASSEIARPAATIQALESAPENSTTERLRQQIQALESALRTKDEALRKACLLFANGVMVGCQAETGADHAFDASDTLTAIEAALQADQIRTDLPKVVDPLGQRYDPS